jgi:predicted negative regulator of RcsB-dependent stress response
MKKLEDIPKKAIFEVPERYFDKLPGVIQSRIEEKNPVRERASYFALSLRYALPAIVLIAASVFVYQNYHNSQASDAESILASVDSQDLVNYLDEDEVSIEDILEDVNASEINPDELNTMELDFSEIDILELSDEFENDQL